MKMAKHGVPFSKRRIITETHMMIMLMTMMMMMMKSYAYADDTNIIFSPCDDAKVKKGDGFTFGLAFSTKESFFLDQTQLSPCDSRLALATKNAKLAIFRPKVDEISLLSIDSTNFNPVSNPRYIFSFRILLNMYP